MQHELTSLLYLSYYKDSNIENVVEKFNNRFAYQYLQDEDQLFPQIRNEVPTILLIDQQDAHIIQKLANNERFENLSIILVGSEEFDDGIESLVMDIVPKPVNKTKLTLALNNSYAQLQMKQEIQRLQNTLSLQNNELHELNNIGIALSAERDPDQLLELILIKSRQITRADAGSLYLVEEKENISPDEKNYFANKQLRFKLAQNDSVSVGFEEFVMPIEKKSIAGYVALSNQALNIQDVYHLPADCEFSHNRSFDESVGYRTKSILVIPMKTHKDEIIGVLQLINRKKNWIVKLGDSKINEEQIIPFDEKCVDLANSLASQAAVSIENNRLYAEIKNLFEGFIRASVHAIEQRDPTTSGHSERVALLTTELAKTVDRTSTGKFKDVKFTRDEIQTIKYAGLLHDFGKIGVRENVLVKAKKLFPHELESIKTRFRLFNKTAELQYSQEKITHLIKEDKTEALSYLKNLDSKIQEIRDELDEYMRIVIEANEPRVMKESGFELLMKIGKIVFSENGQTEQLLTPVEIDRLTIPKGSLSNEERLEIESHVTHTFNFLSKIPWTSELKDVPKIAYAHHEKLDGSGYPRRLNSGKIPIPSKMMAITDIYDALTAWDRPYKKAVPIEKALDILQWEVNDGKLDAELLKIFIEAKIYELVKKPE